ncbi:MAG: hypothetical protein WA937_13345, partial [Flavobacteriales bacterium]
RLGWAIVLCVFPTRIQNTDHKIKTLRKMISTLDGIYIPNGISQLLFDHGCRGQQDRTVVLPPALEEMK